MNFSPDKKLKNLILEDHIMTFSPKLIAVLKGGWSAERSVSLKSGEACAAALREKGYEVVEIDVQPDISEVLTALKPDVAFNALHGKFGEDGCIQGILEILKIPYTHSGVLSSALAMDKDRAKTVLAAAGVPVAKGIVRTKEQVLNGDVLPIPFVAKPVREGSSVGVVIVRDDKSNVFEMLDSAQWSDGEDILVEEYIAGYELTCGVMGDRVLDVIDIVHDEGFYDFTAKYEIGGSKHILPANILPKIYQNIQQFTQIAHNALGCMGVSRADFRLDMIDSDNPRLVCLEVNTQPGMTETSLVPDLARYAGMSFGELVEWITLDASINR